jgi:hypothetical protein
MSFIRIVLFALVMSLSVTAMAEESGTSNAQESGAINMEILRDKIKADKKVVVAANMLLNDAEGKVFWPIYDAYQRDLKKVNMQLGDVIKAYADANSKGAMTKDVARKLMKDTMAVEEAELKLKRTYYPKVEGAIGSVKAARYMQIESKIRAVIKYELADQIPLIE